MSDQSNTAAIVALPQSGALISLDSFKAKIEHQKQMRALLLDYVKSALDADRHFYTIKDGGKPALSQDGARNLCSLYEARPEFEMVETYHDDGHYSVKTTCRLYHMVHGTEMAVGSGSCTTRESRYAYRWAFDNELPRTMNRAELPSRKTARGATMYRIPNEDLADQFNTVIKMSEKRAQTGAVMRLPLVSEVFDADSEEEQAKASQIHQRFLRDVRKWVTAIPKAARETAAEHIFGCALEDIPSLSELELESGTQEIQRTVEGGIDWTSKTLVDDLRTLRQAGAAKATEDLFPQDPRQAAQQGSDAPSTLEAFHVDEVQQGGGA